MIPQIRSELLKIRSTRTTAGLVIGLTALVVLIVTLTASLNHTESLSGPHDQRDLLGISSIGSLFAALAGLLVVTGEYRFGTIRPTFVYTPRRSLVVGAKFAASLLAGLGFGVVAVALAFGLGLGILALRGIHGALSGGAIAQLVLGTLAASALWAGLGAGLGAIVRNQVGSVIGLLSWVFLVENLLFGFVPSVGRFTPGRA